MKKKKILFITHESSNTGAPILLLEFLKWYKVNTNNEIEILTIKDGPLIKEFKKVGSTISLEYNYSPFKRLLKGNKTNKEITLDFLLKQDYDLIFSNTIVNGEILDILKKLQKPIISYVHELQHTIKDTYRENPMLIDGTIDNSEFIICGSEMVRNNLIKNWNIDPEKTAVVNSFIDISKGKEKQKNVAQNLRKEHNIPEDARIVGMMGSFIWRKGADLFIEIARKFKEENIYFVWVGLYKKDLFWLSMETELEKLPSIPNLRIIERNPDYKDYYNLFDLFFLSSREDPYPMVVIEAAEMGIPIVCFNNSTGVETFIDDRIGEVLPYGDWDFAKERIETMMKEIDFRFDKEYIQTKSFQSHNIDESSNKISEIINNYS